MPKFELERLTEYDDQTLLDEIRRVAALVPNGKLTRVEFNKLSKVHPSTLGNRFGTWEKALNAAGIGERFDDSSLPWSREEIIEKLQSCAKSLGRNQVTQRELQEFSGISLRPIHRTFGTFRTALEAAGLLQTALGKRYTDEECFENLVNVWTTLGRQPNYAEMKETPSHVGPKAYVLRWGSWRGALKAFIEKANRDQLVENTSEQPNNETSSLPILPDGICKHVTKRDVNPRLRVLIFSRDKFKCVFCGRSGVELHVDHIIPWSKCGETVIENLQTLCQTCNLGKGDIEL